MQLDKWAEGRNKLIAMLAQFMVLTVRGCHDVMKLARGMPWLTLPDAQGIMPDQWRRLYRKPQTVIAALVNVLGAPEHLDAPADSRAQLLAAKRSFWHGIRQQLYEVISSSKQENEIALKRANRRIDLYYRLVHVPSLIRIIEENEPIPENFREWFSQPAFVFLMGVALPCWLEYGVSIWKLYRRATEGQYEALERILRLDPSLHSDERIGRVLFRMRQRNPEQHAEFLKSTSKGLGKVPDLDEVKYRLAAWLQEISTQCEEVLRGERMIQELGHRVPHHKRAEYARWAKQASKRAARRQMGCQLKLLDICKLFHAAAQDTGQGPVDWDFCGELDSLRKKISRNAKHWPGLRKPDKSHAA